MRKLQKKEYPERAAFYLNGAKGARINGRGEYRISVQNSHSVAYKRPCAVRDTPPELLAWQIRNRVQI